MKRHLKYRRRLHPEDSTSTYLFIKKLELEKYNSVILYKPQGEKYLIAKVLNLIAKKMMKNQSCLLLEFKLKSNMKCLLSIHPK